jgi:hypothetical protein
VCVCGVCVCVVCAWCVCVCVCVCVCPCLPPRPAELKAEIGQLEDERNQLNEKIAKLKRCVGLKPTYRRCVCVCVCVRTGGPLP